MRSFPPLRLLPEDKLDLLRYLDEFRFWHSLDDQRRCARCHHTITGMQVLVFERFGTRGRMRLQCPTAGCMGTASEWIYANPLLAASFKSDTPARRFEASSANRRIIREARRRAKSPEKRDDSGSATSKQGRHAGVIRSRFAIRTILARLPLLRPVATGFHAIHPLL